MRCEFGFTKAWRNPYAKRLHHRVTIRLDPQTIGYFQTRAIEMGIACQPLISLPLRDCAASGHKLKLECASAE